MWFSFVFLYNLFSYLKTYRNREITFRQPSGPPRAPQGTIILTNARGTTKNGSDFSENCRKSARGLSANQRVSSWEGGTVGALGLKNPTGPGVPSHSGSVVYIMGSVFCVAGPTHPYNGMGEDQGCRSNFPLQACNSYCQAICLAALHAPGPAFNCCVKCFWTNKAVLPVRVRSYKTRLGTVVAACARHYSCFTVDQALESETPSPIVQVNEDQGSQQRFSWSHVSGSKRAAEEWIYQGLATEALPVPRNEVQGLVRSAVGRPLGLARMAEASENSRPMLKLHGSHAETHANTIRNRI